MTSPDFTVLDELPPKAEEGVDGHPAKALFRFCVANPERWVEAYRGPRNNDGGTTNSVPYVKAKRLREYGLETEIRRDGGDRVLYVRLVPGAAGGAA